MIALIEIQSPVAEKRLILWVDDNPENNAKEVRKAKKLGIDVVQVEDTTEAFAYLNKNKHLQKAHPQAFRYSNGYLHFSNQPRIITDANREEDGGSDAGRSLVRQYVHIHHFEKPHSQFVLDYENQDGIPLFSFIVETSLNKLKFKKNVLE